MIERHPPFLELGFYFADRHTDAAFLTILEAAQSHGARFSGTGWAHLGAGVQSKPFASIRDFDASGTVRVSSIDDVRDIVAAPDMRLIDVDIAGLLDDHNEPRREAVTCLSISNLAAGRDHHPIAVWADGEAFSGMLEEDRDLWMNRGSRAYHVFRDLVVRTAPSYAAITVDYALECPVDLAVDGRSYAFADFFIGNRYFCMSEYQMILSAYSEAYVEELRNGWYISTTAMFNPHHHGTDSLAVTEAMATVSSVIGAKALR